MALINVRGLEKSYGSNHVLRGIDLTVGDGEILGILGSNGSGKTTAVECIGGLRSRDAGSVDLAGMDPAANPRELRQILGMQLQQCRLPGKIRVAEALGLYSSFYTNPRPCHELLERFGLASHAAAQFDHLSGGQQQRLSVALALVGRPRIAFLDELTTGLDPVARRDIWEYLGLLRDEGVTMVLVTHFMDEAQHLCDRLVVLDEGRVVAQGSPDDVAGSGGRQEISFDSDPAVSDDLLTRVPGVTGVRTERGRTVVTGDADSPQAVMGALASAGITVRHLRVSSPSLDDAFLTLTQDREH